MEKRNTQQTKRGSKFQRFSIKQELPVVVDERKNDGLQTDRSDKLSQVDEGSKEESIGEEDLAPKIELGAIKDENNNERENEEDSESKGSFLAEENELIDDDEVDDIILNARDGIPRRIKSFIKMGELNSVFSFCMPERVPETNEVEIYVHPNMLPGQYEEQAVQTKLSLVDKKFDNLTKNAFIFEDLLNDYLYKKEFENMMMEEGKIMDMEHGDEFLSVISDINKIASQVKGAHEDEKLPQPSLDITTDKHILKQTSSLSRIMKDRQKPDLLTETSAEVIDEAVEFKKPRSKTTLIKAKTKANLRAPDQPTKLSVEPSETKNEVEFNLQIIV